MEKIRPAARYFGLPLELVVAICEVESSFRPWASKYEPAFKRRYVDPLLANARIVCSPLEAMLLGTSCGIMQVMGLVAWELGLKVQELPKLFIPSGGLWYGCRKLRQLKKRYQELPAVISAYNQGSPRRNAGGQYRNQAYVDKVMGAMERLKSEL